MAHQYGAGTSALFPSGITGWHLKTNTPSQGFDFVGVVKTALGYFIPDSMKARGKKTTVNETWEPDGDATDACVVRIGKTGALSAVDNAKLDTPNSGRPQLSASGHVHDEAEDASNAHLDGYYDVTFVFPTGAYGAVNPFTGATITGLSDYEIQSASQTASMEHQDENGISGKFVVGASRGVKIEASLSAVSGATLALSEDNGGWLMKTKSEPQTNEGLRKVTITGEMYIDESAT